MKRTIHDVEHYTWGDNCDGWHLVHQPSLGVIRERMPAGAAETRHRHAKARQFFYLIAGVAEFEADGTHTAVKAGEGFEVEPGVAHQIRNPGPTDLEFIVISHPHSHGDRQPA